ncbi:unnamed protein product [Phaedon cochleariae]|uniref:Major facilitator superfamily (MFS) profile domain-containing protein n=1 Tax=Phaedon cochleariae TaxID=80249 RepID=A0A9P0GHA0_PHACE|nr:unnamed protein product [Phaedon cochleariae]
MAHVPISKRKKSHEHDIHKFQGKESILTSQINLYVEETKPKIPDGGWGWMVLFAAFMLNTISEGVSFSFGLLLIEFLKEFGASKSATSWIGGLFLAIPLLAGPIGSAMVDRYGCVSMTILGGLVCATGFVLSVFADSLAVLYVTFGVVGGIGRGLTFVTAVVSLAFWFERRRTVAVGLAASGAGFGTIVFAPLTTRLLEGYGWRGTMLVLAGGFLNMCVCGAVMRDPAWIVRETQEKKSLKSNKDDKEVNSTNSKLNEIKLAFGNGEDVQVLLQRVDTKPDLTEKNRFRSVVDLPTFLKKNETVPVEVLKQLSENKELYQIVMENYPHLLSKCTSNQDLHVTDMSHARIPMKLSLKVKKADNVISEEDESTEINHHSSPLLPHDQIHHSKANIPSHSYLSHLKLNRPSIDAKSVPWKPQIFNMSISSPDVYKSTVKTIPQNASEKKWYSEFYQTVKSLVDFSLFLELHFLLLAISTVILFVWFIVPYFYLAEHMVRIGYSENQAAYSLSAIGFTNTAGMIILGWVGVRLNIAKTYAVCLLLCGVSIAFMMFLTDSYTMLMINSALFGLFFSSCFSLLPSLLAELVPLEDFTNSYGLILMCMGVGNLTGPPLAGFLFDWTGSWEQSFYQAAVWIIVCGVLVGIIPFTKNRRIIGSGPTLLERDNDAVMNYS